MSSWFANRKKSPKLTNSTNSSVLSSGSVEKPSGPWLEGDGQGLHNPLAWDSIPSSLQEKFPHWKEKSPLTQRAQAQHSGNQVSGDHSYSCYKTTYNTKQQPDFTFPYVVMENDSLNSIAVKFETTPTELTRLNKKPTPTIFTGEVLYIPDQDEIARSAPKSAPPSISHLSASDQYPGSVDSQETLRSASVSNPLPENSPIGLEDGKCDSDPFEKEEEVVEGGKEEESKGEILSPSNSIGLFEEVADTHIVLVSRYISDDQGCVRGNLMINPTAIMFTPFPAEPLVMEHGSASFEIMIPLQDISFAAFAKDVSPPQSKMALRAALLEAEEKTAEHLSLTGDQQESKREDGETSQGGKVEEKTVIGSQENGTNDNTGPAEQGNADLGDDKGAGQTENCLDHKDTVSAGQESGGADSQGEGHLNLQNSAEELLAIMGNTCSPRQFSRRESLHTTSEHSTDSFLSDQPCFLHIRVSHKCSATHTYTPINRGVGIDIPHGEPSPNKSLLQQVKTTFCFAVADNRTNDLAGFITKHHPAGARYNPTCPFSWSGSEATFEFISYEETASHEDLNFSDNHFKGAESSESWEVYSLKDVSRYRQKIDKMEVEAGLPLPNLSEPSSLMEEAHLRALSDSNNILSAAVGHDWFLIYSTFKHGISLRTLYRNMVMAELPESAIVLLVRDEQNKLFGAALTVSLRLSEKFYGTGESYLFSFESHTDLKVYTWTGENSYFVKGSADGVCIGCGDGHAGLWLDESLLSGTSEECATFGNNCLSSKSEFICTGVEAWGFL